MSRSMRHSTTGIAAAAAFAAVLLCILVAGTFASDDSDSDAAMTATNTSTVVTATGTDPESDPDPTCTVTFTPSKSGDSSTPTYDKAKKRMTVTVTAKAGYCLPKTISSLTVTHGTFEKFSTNDRHTGTIVIKNVTGDVKFGITMLNVNTVTIEYTVDGKLKVDSSQKAIEGEAFSGKMPKVTGHNYPKDISVKSGTDTITSTYDPSTGAFSIPATSVKTSDFKVTGTYTLIEFDSSIVVMNGSFKLSDLPKPLYGKDYKFTITALENYMLPDPKDLYISAGTSKYTYDATTGLVVIEKVYDDVTVTAKCDPTVYSITYMDGDEEMDIHLDSYYYGVGCTLPTDVQKKDYIFVCWKDEKGNKVTAVSSTSKADIKVFAEFKDDLSGYDLGKLRTPYYIVAVLGIIGMALVVVAARMRS